jgi:Cd2+/Zn2+-exporting ATPase
MEKKQPKTSTFFVEGMCCADEELTIRKKLTHLSGVKSCSFNLVAQKLTVEHEMGEAEIVRALREVGFKAREAAERIPGMKVGKGRGRLLSIVVCGALTISGVVLHRLGFPFTVPIFLLAIALGGWRIALKGLKAVRTFAFDMNFLMTVAVVGAMAIRQWEEAAVVTFLFALALHLESYTMEKTRNAIRSLIQLSPSVARVRRNDRETEVPAEEVSIGEHIVIRPGEKIPLDGEVVAGKSYVNQAPITGESIPAEKNVGAAVYAGSINEKGTLEVMVTKRAEDTTLARIIHLVEEAQGSRAPSQTFVERFSQIYSPAVIGLAVLLSVVPPLLFSQPFEEWFYRSLVLLVIACPCALVISTPVTIVSGLTNAARNGILIKGGAHLEMAGSLKVIAFDKTGTLTFGVPSVTDVISLNTLSQKDIVSLAAALETYSEHHLGDAIIRYAREKGIPYDGIIVEQFESLTGRGIRATLNGETYYIGNHALAEERGICSPRVEERLRELEGSGKTTIILGTEKEAIGILAVADKIRPESREAIQSLHQNGIEKVVMLTGDNPGTARSIANDLKIDEYRAELLPQQKVEAVKDLLVQYGTVGMVGDGINDAPALAASSLGIAMGTVGSDTALETADIALMSDDLSKVSYTISLSRKTLRLIKQNITLSILIKLVFLGLAIPGVATLWMAIAADEGAALLVIFNALRVLNMRDHSLSNPSTAGLSLSETL